MKAGVFIITILFFLIYSFLPFGTINKFTSPDETANYFFSKLYAESNALYLDKLDNNGTTVIHPRSSVIINDYLAPTSFLGLPILYGLIGKFLGTDLIPFLTPMFTAISSITFFYLLKNILKRVAFKQLESIVFASFIFYLAHPAIWYYSSRSMFHNMLFISLLIIGSYFLERFITNLSNINNRGLVGRYLILASVFITLALTVRVSEALWVILILLFVWLYNYKKIRFWHVVTFISIAVLIFLSTFYYNNLLYGKWYSFGYNADYGADNNTALYDSLGVKPRLSLVNFYNYFIVLFWWLFVLFLIGLIWFFWMTKKQNPYILIPIILSGCWLIIFYGSFAIQDTLGNQQVTIGTSYVRYWLPLYIITIPFIGFFVVKFSYLFGRFARTVNYLILLIIVSFSGYFVFAGTTENLIHIKDTVINNQKTLETIKQLIPLNSIIVSDHEDKIFFPDFRVINSSKVMTLKDKTVIKQLSLILSNNQVYYYNFLKDKDIVYLNQSFLKPVGLKLNKTIYLETPWRLDKMEKIID